MGQSDLLGPGLGDGGGPGLRGSVPGLLLHLPHSPCAGVDFVVVLIPSRQELDLINRGPIVGIQLAFVPGSGLRRHACVGQSNLPGTGLGDGGRFSNGNRPGLRFKFDHRSGKGVDFAIVLAAPGGKLHVIDHRAVIEIQLDFIRRQAPGGYPGLFQRDLPGTGLADISLVAGRPHGLHPGIPLAAPQQEVQFVNGQLRQLLKGVVPIFVQNRLDQLGLSHRNAVFPGQLLQIVVFLHGLAQHRTAEGVGFQQLVDLCRQALLQRSSAGGIRIVHADENGVRQLA